MLDAKVLVKSFAAIGATLVPTRTRTVRGSFGQVVRFDEIGGRRQSLIEFEDPSFRLDIARRQGREFYTLRYTDATPEMRVLQQNALARHLLLHVPGADGGQRLLCGHDERHWFVAGIDGRVSTITEARRNLLPKDLRHLNLDPDTLARRDNAYFRRQGEWFFVPTARDFTGVPIHQAEPLRRDSRSKPHIVRELVRFGGTACVLYQGREYSLLEWEEKLRDPRFRPAGRVERVVKDPEVYVRGTVRHDDHATITLEGWHRVYVNGEIRNSNVSFYD